MDESWRSSEEPRRLAALRALMAQRGLDAVVIVGGTNLSYFSGFAGVERSMARAMLYIFPLHGEPALVAHTFRKHLIEAHSWVSRFHYFTQLAAAPVEATLSALAAMGLARGRLGFELGFESQIQMPTLEFEHLRRALSGFEFVDIARDLWRIRSIRSDAELARHRVAASVVVKVFVESFAFVHAGMRQVELSSFVQGRLFAHGVAQSFTLVSAGSDNYDFCGAWTPEYTFQHGDMVWMDIGAMVAGYSMLFSRAGVIGGPSPEQVSTAAQVHAATMAGVQAVGPGVPIADVAMICERALEAVAAPVRTNIAELGTRFGHGVGIEFIEPPHLAVYDNSILVPGMLIAVEPGISTAYGRFHFREVVAVTADGYEQISGPPAELLTLPST